MTQWLLIRRMRGPAYLLLIGIMAMLHEWTDFGFGKSWPLLLILGGLLALAERAALAHADMEGYDPVTGDPRFPGAPPAPPYSGSAYSSPGTSIVPNPTGNDPAAGRQ